MQLLSQGNHSAVYAFESPEFAAPVILKVLTTENPNRYQMERLRNEHQITTQLFEKQPFAQVFRKVLTSTSWQGKPALVLEFIQGQTMADVFSQPQSPARFISLAIELATALSVMHQQGILHQNISPSNGIIREQDQQLVLIDFGLASNQDVQVHGRDISHYEGSLAYIAPEQTGRMHHRVDSRSDLYSLGATLYELLTGEQPFEAADSLGMVYAHLAKAPVPPHLRVHAGPWSGLDFSGLSKLLLKLLAKNPEDRYQTAEGLRADLEECQKLFQIKAAIPEFDLGLQDIPEKFLVSERLYGRQREITSLLNIFETITSPTGPGTALVLVAGYSGVGKTCLIQEIHKPLLEKRGHFMFGGKFDQLQRHIPYAAFIQGLNDLVRYLLSESTEVLQSWKSRILDAVGPNAQVLIEMIPEIKLILGEQPPIARLSALETQNRFHHIMQKFIQAMSAPEHPLVFFIDDLQWADTASLNLLKVLLVQTQIQGFLVLGAYRNNEVDADHPFAQLQSELQAKDRNIHEIQLSNLDLGSIQSLIADTLRCSIPAAAELTGLIYSKTQGNAFFVHQFLTALYQDGLLQFERAQRKWVWDIQQIRTRNVTDNVANLMTEKVKKLPEQSQELLKFAACMGNSFDLQALGRIRGTTSQESLEDLMPALQDGFVLALSEQNLSEGSYRFLHDRVQQAAYAMLPDSWRKPVHLKIGRLLLEDILPADQAASILDTDWDHPALPDFVDERIFDLIAHFNSALDLMQDPLERRRVAGLNLLAARKATASAAFDSVVRFTQHGIALLSEAAWQTDYQLTFNLYLERVEAESMLGHYALADSLYPLILRHIRSTQDIGRLYYIRLTYYGQQARYAEVIEIMLEALSLMGENIPATEAERAVLLPVVLQQNLALMKGRRISELADLPEMQDPETRLKTQLITAGQDSVSGSGMIYLLGLLSAKVVQWTLKDGNSEGMILSYVFYSRVVREHLGDFESALAFGDLALTLAHRYNNPIQTCKIYTAIGAIVGIYGLPLNDCLAYLKKSNQILLESSHWVYTPYNFFFMGLTTLISGMTLADVYQETAQALEFLKPFKSAKVRQDLLYQLVYRPVQLLCGLSEGPTEWSCEDKVFQERYAKQDLIMGNYAASRLQVAFLFEDFDTALSYLPETLEKACLKIPYLTGPESCFYAALVCLAVCDNPEDASQNIWLGHARELLAQLKTWAEFCEENYGCKYRLVAAEMARVEGHPMAAMDLYEQVLAKAQQSESWRIVGLVNQLAGRFYHRRGQLRIAGMYFKEAQFAYTLWGASALVQHLDKQYAQLSYPGSLQNRLTSPVGSPSGHEAIHLDVLSLIKSSQALSSEVELTPLLTKLLQIVMENAGAQKAALLQLDGEHCFLEALAQGETIRIERVAFQESQELAHSVVHFVLRTQQSVLLADGMYAPAFAKDPYILLHQPKSMLCLPLLNQGQLNGILYLENNLAKGAFSDEHVQILNLLATQAAISLENTRLYQLMRQQNILLEQKVLERTAQLTRANQAKSSFLANISHEIRTPLNAIIGFSRLLHDAKKWDTESRSQLNIILQSGDHLLKLINDVLEMSKVEAGNLSLQEVDFDLYALLTELKGMMQLRAQDKQLVLEFDIDKDVPRYVRTDEKKLRQLLINFLNNSLKYTEAGLVRLHVSQVDSQAQTCYLSFAIADTGIGISEQSLIDIFQPFVQVEQHNRVREGVGLGLSISQKLIETMGGKLTVQSQLDKGSLFRFVLPMTVLTNALPVTDAPSRRVTGLKPGQPQIRILIVDDDINNRLLLSQYLQPVGFALQLATQGLEAVEACICWQPQLVLMDMRMPVMDGYEATRRIKNNQQPGHAPFVVAVTASAFEEEREKVLAAGCDAFLRKPVKKSEVLEMIAQFLQLEYLYEDTVDDSEIFEQSINLPFLLRSLPSDLLSQLQEAAELGHMELISLAITAIRPYNVPLTQALHDLAEQFDYGGILDLIDQASLSKP